MEDEEDKEPFAFIQKERLLFRRGHSTQSANLDSGIGHTVQYKKSGRQLATRLGMCSRSGFPISLRQFTSDEIGRRLHIPSRVANCLPDFVYWTVWPIPESRLAD